MKRTFTKYPSNYVKASNIIEDKGEKMYLYQFLSPFDSDIKIAVSIVANQQTYSGRISDFVSGKFSTIKLSDISENFEFSGEPHFANWSVSPLDGIIQSVKLSGYGLFIVVDNPNWYDRK